MRLMGVQLCIELPDYLDIGIFYLGVVELWLHTLEPERLHTALHQIFPSV